MRSRLAISMAAALMTSAAQARADDSRPPLPEPLLDETATDIDSDEEGEYHLSLNGSVLRARTGAARSRRGSVDVEWQPTRRFGLRLEPGVAQETDVSRLTDHRGGVALTLSWKLLHDFANDFHLQLEAGGRAPWDANHAVTPGETDHPGAVDLRSALRLARLTLRGSLGADTDGSTVHLRGSLALLTGFDRAERFGFWGVELEQDSGNARSFVVAPNIVADVTSVGLPLRLGLALPVVPRAADTEPSFGVFVRIIVVASREAEYGRTGESH